MESLGQTSNTALKSEPHSSTRWWSSKHIFFSLFSMLIGLLIVVAPIELYLRFKNPQPVLSYLKETTGEQYTDGDFNTFTLKKNYHSRMPSMEHPGQFVTINTNSLGLRNPEVQLQKPSGIKRVLVLGDSYTFGVYVEDHETYPAQLQKLLDPTGKKVEVINAGYADGWGPDEHLVWLKKRGLAFKPDLVIYGFFVGNDFSDVKPQNWIEKDADGLPERIRDPNIYIDASGSIRSRIRDSKTVGADWVYRIPILRESHAAIWVQRKWLALQESLEKRPQVENGGWGHSPFAFVVQTRDEAHAQPEMVDMERNWLKVVNGNAVRIKARAAGGAGA